MSEPPHNQISGFIEDVKPIIKRDQPLTADEIIVALATATPKQRLGLLRALGLSPANIIEGTGRVTMVLCPPDGWPKGEVKKEVI